MSESIPDPQMNDKTSDNNCVVCCREVSIYAIGECDHPVCYQCATRMRVLCKQNECPICRRDLPKVYFCKERMLFSVAANARYQFCDRKYSLYFEDRDVQLAQYNLVEHACSICSNGPVFDRFNALKDHVRKVHDLFYCDICVKHLMIFTQERKCYSRQDLARHRRVGDVDDTSHRGHPLCEFCDERYLDSDELYRHLRREHFYCHFCDLDGLNHYYSDYEYLRKHFRVEHYLCEEGECLNEKFTTAFRTEIDLKAHRATVHNKGLSKAQVKQARTLELEFTIAPRGSATFNDSPSSYYRSEESNPRRGRRGGSHRGGSYHSRAEDSNECDERHSAPQNVAPPPSSIDMNNSQDFPVLGMAVARGGSPAENRPTGQSSAVNGSPIGSGGGAPVNTLARKLAKLNRFTVDSRSTGGSLDEEFPALHPGREDFTGPASGLRHPSKTKGASKSWGASGSTTLSLTSSRAPVPNVGSKLTLKLNSQEEFPGLANRGRGGGGGAAPNVSIQVSRNQKVANLTGPWEGGAAPRPAAKSSGTPNSQPVVVTRLVGSQNITFLNPPPSSAAAQPSNSNAAASERRDSASGLSKGDSGNWYVLKKGGKATKRNSVPDVFSTASEEFPALDIRSAPNAPKKETSLTVPIGNSWKPSVPSESKSSKSAANDARAAANGPQKPAAKNKKKKAKAVPNVVNDLSTTGKTPKEATAPPLEDKSARATDESGGQAASGKTKENVELKRTELKIEKLSPAPEAQVPNGYEFATDDFPSLDTSSKPASAPPPPGFSRIATKSTRPPPGFVLPAPVAVPKPPPGFGSVVAVQSPTTPTSVTFTNSSGQNFALPGPIPLPAAYLPPEGFQLRNAELTAVLLDVLDGSDDDRFATFKTLSAKFRQGEMSAAEYYEQCSRLMEGDKFGTVFPELLVLLPDIGKQQELLAAHNRHRKQNANQCDGGNNNNVVFLVCASCQQVLNCKDFRSHETSHKLDDNFPSLGGVPVQTSHVSWMKHGVVDNGIV